MKIVALPPGSFELPPRGRERDAGWPPRSAAAECSVDLALDFLLACAACEVPLDLAHHQASRRARSRIRREN